MLIIIDRKLPREAKERLLSTGTVLELETEGLVYPAVSGHPDIFLCQTPQTLVISPSLPLRYVQYLEEHHVTFISGNKKTGIKYPSSVHYNAAVSDHYFVHRLEYTDPVLLQQCHALKKVPVKQGYTRCNLFLLRNDHYLTSDQGIHTNLQRSGLSGIFVSPDGVLLPGFPNGFIGGAMGILNNTVYIAGNLSHFPKGETVKNFLVALGYEIIELYEGPLFDSGGILFIQ
ncbi:MAG: DUF6873 family GME fold protein [Bacteroidales bacterium]|jgi:hypothetical protein